MIQRNYDYITTELLPALGFKGGLFDEPIKAAMEAGVEKIQKAASETKGDTTRSYEITLDKKGDAYFLNSVKATISGKEIETISHTFNLDKQRGFNKEQMDNLLAGRSVYKSKRDENGERVGVWTRLDLTKTNDSGNFVTRTLRDENHDFRVSTSLKNLPLTRMTEDEKEDMLKALNNGNMVPWRFNTDKGIERLTMVANPVGRRVSVFNQAGKEVWFDVNKNLKIEEPKPIPENSKKVIKANAEKENGQKQGSSLKVV